MRERHLAAFAALLAGSAALPVLAQEDRIAQIEARVAELEQRPKLSFGVGGIDLTVYGYVKGDLIYDLDSDLGNTFAGIGSLTPGGDTGSNFRGHAFQSRLGIRATLDGATAVLEGDFFGSGGGQFRLRQAYVDVGAFRFGQNWTNFMPIESYPSTLDFQGPAGIPFSRVVQARYTWKGPNGLGFSASVEDPAGDSSDPALTGAVFYQGERFFAKLAAIGTRVNDPAGEVDGWGVNLSGNAQLWEGGTINASFTTGEAISSYMVFGGDDTFGGQAVESTGVTIGLSQKVNKWTFGAVYGLRENDIGAPTDTERLQTLHLTANYQLRENLTAGLEYITGERDLFDGSSVDADRVQAAVQFNF